jgi:hypothetical protein
MGAALGISLTALAAFGPPDTQHDSKSTLCLLAFVGVLILKDLLPAGGITGSLERAAALGTTQLQWPATARNPEFGRGASQAASLLLAITIGALVCTVASRGGKNVGVITGIVLAGALGFTACVYAGMDTVKPYGPENHTGLVVSKNGAATVVALGVILIFGPIASAARRRSLVSLCLLFVCGALSFAVLAKLNSLTGVLVAVVGPAGFLFLSDFGRRQQAQRFLWAIAAATLSLFLIVLANADIAGRLGGLFTDYRWQIWRDVWPMLKAFPLWGVGQGAFERVYPLFGQLAIATDSRLAHPDSSWVLLVVEWGLLPTVAMVGFFVRLLARAIRALAGQEPGVPRDLNLAALCALVGWLAAAFTDTALHRRETLLIGAILTGLVAAVSPPRATSARGRFWWLPTTGAVALALVFAGWAYRVGLTAPRWGLLDPERQWLSAVAALQQGATVESQLPRFRAAVRLQHRSAIYPLLIARFIHPSRPEAAAEFWQAVFRRSGEMGAAYLSDACSRWPQTSTAYWRAVLNSTDPDLILLLPVVSPSEQLEILQSWLDGLAHRPPVPPRSWKYFLDATVRAGAFSTLVRGLTQVDSAPAAFWEQSCRALLAAQNPRAALYAATHLLVGGDETADFPTTPPLLGLNTLLALGRFPEVQALVRQTTNLPPDEQLEMLAKICAKPGAPAWFHLRYSRVAAASGHEALAAEQILAAVAKPQL